jgi:hypothetical protein
MYYDNKNKIIVESLPKNSIGPDGNFYINFDEVDDVNLLASHNYLTIRSDQPEKPSDKYVENIKKRTIIIDYPYVDIVRTWKLNIDPEDT